MNTLPFGEWAPDLAALDNNIVDIENVLAGANSYLPMASLAPLATTLQSLAFGGNDSYTKILLHCDGADASTTFSDTNAGGSAHTWTAAGNAQIDTAQSKFGGASGLFDGTGDWITTPDHADFALGTSDFTLDMWVRPAADGTGMNLFGQADVAGADVSIAGYRASNNKIGVDVGVGGGGITLTSTSTVLSGSWTHIAVVRNGSSFALYINGTSEATATNAGSVNDSASAFRIGAYGEFTTNPWNGWIDEVRLSVGIARRVGNFTPLTYAYFQGGTCVGLTVARTATAGFAIFAGTATKLFKWASTGWTDVSRTSGGNYNVASGDLWMWQQVGTFLYATNINDALQRIDVDSGTNFAAVSGSPPQATNITQIGPHTVLAGLSSNRRKIQWSATEDPTGWTVGTSNSDEQEMPDGGPVMGVAGDESVGYVVQDQAIRVMQYLPGDTTFIFRIDRVVERRGSVSKYGFATVAGILYFLAEDGFYALAGQQLIPIGDNKVNDWFLANSDPARRNQVHCFVTPHAHRVYWAYHGSAAATSYDKLIYYDWVLQRWSKASISAQVWSALASTGLDLDTTGGETDDSLLDSSASSLDAYIYVGGRPTLGAIDTAGLLSFQTGPNLAATITTVESHLIPGKRAFVNEVYPVIDAESFTVAAGTRERLQDTVLYGSEEAVESNGTVPLLSSAKLQRFRVSIPAMETWTHAQGVMVDAQSDGMA